MKHLHPGLGGELPERSYGSDCRTYVPENPTNRFINIQETLFDEFIIAHVMGWWGKAVMIRNQLLLWVLSVGFELMEVRKAALTTGMHTVHYFDGKTYEWVGLSRQPSIMAKVKRSLCQFTPAKWDKDQWHPFMEPRRFIQVFCLCVGFMTVELNTFFLKLSLDSSQEPLGCLSADPLLVDCYPGNSFVSRSNAHLVDYFLDFCGDFSCAFLAGMVTKGSLTLNKAAAIASSQCFCSKPSITLYLFVFKITIHS
uniref:CDP-diacylglycerol--serine O-phosphatidyltransferase n=1 Tax=Oryza punctata TaxID=4537 RepID=A0A0E0JMI6_ORYPU